MPPTNRRIDPNRRPHGLLFLVALALALPAPQVRSAEPAPVDRGVCERNEHGLFRTALAPGACTPRQPLPQVPGVTGCSVHSTACPTWISDPYDYSRGQDSARGDVLALAPGGDTVYMGHSSGEAGLLLNAYAAADGALEWSTQCCETFGTGFPISHDVEVSRDGNVVFFTAWIQDVDGDPVCTGVLNAYDARTGTQLWAQRNGRRVDCWLPDAMVPYGGGVALARMVLRTDGNMRSIVDLVEQDGTRATVYRGPEQPAGGRRLQSIDDLGTAPGRRRLYVLETKGVRDEWGWYDPTGWSITSLEVSGDSAARVWTHARTFRQGKTNPLSGVVISGDRVVVAGTFTWPFRAFAFALRTSDGTRVWQRAEESSQSWPHAPLATDGDNVFLAIGNWETGLEVDGTNDVLAFDLRTGVERWRDSFRSPAQEAATAYDPETFPLVAVDPGGRVVYEVIRGYGHFEVRALTAATGRLRWYSDYVVGQRAGSSDAEVAPGGKTLFLGGRAYMNEERHADTMVLRYDDVAP